MGLLDNVDELKVANSVMAELGFEDDNQHQPQPQFFQPQQELQQAQQQLTQQVEQATYVVEEDSEEDEQNEIIDAELTEAEIRLSKAQLYKQFITGSIFDGNGAGVKEVSDEFRDFARRQLQILLGVTPKVDQSQFTEDEVKVLKIFTNRILQNPKLLQDKPAKQPQTPQLQPRPVSKPVPVVQAPPPPKPVIQPPKKPQLRSRQVPEEVQSKPAQAKPPKTRLKLSEQPIAKTLANPPKMAVPENGSVVEENGRHYRIRYSDMPNIDEFGVMDGGKIRMLGNGESCILSNGIQVFKTGNEVSKVLRTAFAPNTNVPGKTPFPSNEQMAAITANQAVQAAGRLPPTLNSILGRK